MAEDYSWYNNDRAEGSQTYPMGIHKYYDMHSIRGYANYWIVYALMWQSELLMTILTSWNIVGWMFL